MKERVIAKPLFSLITQRIGEVVSHCAHNAEDAGSNPASATINLRNMEYTNIETSVASAILEKSVGELKLDGHTYKIAPPTIATLILVSEVVATLPVVDREKVTKDDIVASALHNAKDYKALGTICAILILGAKEVEKKTFLRRVKRCFHIGKTEKVDELAREILLNVRPTVLFDILIKRLQDMEISSFFAITTSLSEANILRPTKEVEKH